MLTLNADAMAAYNKYKEMSVVNETVDWIVATVLSQEIVTFCSHNGQVSFDCDDLVEG
tara:strand:- start:46 stop:219 length:174 start_codon:yes stop_codon:yes gene_type:complete